MVRNYSLLLLVLFYLFRKSYSFSVSKKSIPEFTIQEADDDDDTLLPFSIPTPVASKENQHGKERRREELLAKSQLIAVTAGTVLKVNVGDMSDAHKAWKKRRRSDSPLLVPCSVLSVSRTHAVVSNIVFLVKKFGTGHRYQQLTVSELRKWYKKHLFSNLNQQVELLGYQCVTDLLQETFGDKDMPHWSGIKFDPYSETMRAPWSRKRAHATLHEYAVLHFVDATNQQLDHTGRVRMKNTISTTSSYRLEDLSAALRLQGDDTSISSHSDCYAMVYDFDEAGDAGAPLLRLSLNPKQPLSVLNKKPQSTLDRKQQDSFDHELRDLRIGDALNGTVAAVRGGYALVDCKVGNNAVKVWGRLRFQDAIEMENESASRPNKKVADDDSSRLSKAIQFPSKPKFLKIDDRLNVYVKSISTQSNTFTLTMDASIVGKTYKTVKKESHATKKLSRLLEQVGGRKTLESIVGRECDGFVKAMSNTGDWVYVQPMLGGDCNLPIGIASSGLELKKGDNVRIRLKGVDEDRGQLSIEVLSKI